MEKKNVDKSNLSGEAMIFLLAWIVRVDVQEQAILFSDCNNLEVRWLEMQDPCLEKAVPSRMDMILAVFL